MSKLLTLGYRKNRFSQLVGYAMRAFLGVRLVGSYATFGRRDINSLIREVCPHLLRNLGETHANLRSIVFFSTTSASSRQMTIFLFSPLCAFRAPARFAVRPTARGTIV